LPFHASPKNRTAIQYNKSTKNYSSTTPIYGVLRKVRITKDLAEETVRNPEVTVIYVTYGTYVITPDRGEERGPP
jgi:hypothetical protein